VSRTVCELCKSVFLSTKHSGMFNDDVTLKDVNILFDKILIKASEEEVFVCVCVCVCVGCGMCLVCVYVYVCMVWCECVMWVCLSAGCA